MEFEYYMRIDIVTLFPDFVRQCVSVGVVGRAQRRELLQLVVWNLRDYATDRYRSVDGRTCGGGAGMVLLIDPLRSALDAIGKADDGPAHVIYLSPQGARLTQKKVESLSQKTRIALICGRYEGVDERFLACAVDEELSIGDYVLSGGELGAAVLVDAVGRLQDGVLQDVQSAEQDSFSCGLLDYPHYARPVHDSLGDVPEVLLDGNHASIRRWRLKQSLGRTWLRRPDLLTQLVLDEESRSLLHEFRREYALSVLAKEDEHVKSSQGDCF